MNSVLNIAARVSSDTGLSNKSGKADATGGKDEFSQALTVAGNSKQKTAEDNGEEPVVGTEEEDVSAAPGKGNASATSTAGLLPDLGLETLDLPVALPADPSAIPASIPVADSDAPTVPVKAPDIDEQLLLVVNGQLPKAIIVAADGKPSVPVKSADTADTDDDTDLSSDDAAADALTALQVPSAVVSLLSPVTQPVQADVTDDTGVIVIKSDNAGSKDGNVMAMAADGVSAQGSSGGTGLSGDQSGADTPSDNGKVFRFQKADGTGQSVDLNLSTSADGNLDIDASLSSSGQADTVTVLDARRYIGLAPTGNPAMLTAAMSGDSEWVSAMQPESSLANSAAVSSTGKVVNTLKLQMNPGDLGAVTATMRLSGEELSIHLTVHTSAAYRELTSGSSAMLDALRAQGFSVDQVSVSMASTSTDSNSNQQSSQLGQQAAQQGQREGQEARQSQRPGQGAASTSGMENQNDAASDANVAAAARSGHVYL